MTTSNNTTKKKKRRWLTVSMRTMFIVMTLLCIVLGRWGSRWQDQVQITKLLKENSGEFDYEEWYEIEISRRRPRLITQPQSAVQRLKLWIAKWLGADAVVSLELVRVSSQKQVDAVSKLHGVKDLYITATGKLEIDVSSISRLKDLEHLTIEASADSKIKDPAEHLHCFHKLINLRLKKTPLSSLDFLNNLADLETIDVSDGTKITSVKPLRNCSKLRKLCLVKCPATDFSSLTQLRELTEVDLSWSAIQSLEPFRHHQNLRFLDVRHTGIDSLEPLADLTNLEELSFHRTWHVKSSRARYPPDQSF